MKKLLFILIVCSGFICFGQNTEKNSKLAKHTLVMDGEYVGTLVHKLGKNGMFLYSFYDSKKGKFKKWKIDHLDNNLSLVKSHFIEVPKSFFFDESYQNGNDLYLIYSNKKVFKVFRISAITGLVTKSEGLKRSGSIIKHFSGIENFLVIFMRKKTGISNYTSTVYSMDLSSGKFEEMVFNIEKYNPKDITFLRTDPIMETKELMINVKATESGNRNNYVLRYNSEGKLQSTFCLSKDNQVYYYSGATSTYCGKGCYMYTGNYWSEKKTPGGLYLCKTQDNKRDYVRFYEFNEFKYFASFVPTKKNGKQRRLEYSSIPHSIISVDSGFYYIGESRYKTYSAENYDIDGGLSTKKIFEGFRYSHFSIAYFNENGEMNWAKSYEMHQSETPKWRKRFVKSYKFPKTNELNLSYKKDTEVQVISLMKDGSSRDTGLFDFSNIEETIGAPVRNPEFWYDNFYTVVGDKVIDESGNPTFTMYKVAIH